MKFLEYSNGEFSGPALDVDRLIRLGNAFGSGHTGILLGRWSSDAAAMARTRALTAGMLAAGAAVTDGGCLPPPVLTFLAKESGFNAVCTVLPDRVRFCGSDDRWIADFRGGRSTAAAAPEAVGTPPKPMPLYLRRLAQIMDLEAVKAAQFRIRLRAAGAADIFARKLLEKLRCRIAGPEEACDAEFRLSPDGTLLRIGSCGPEMTVRMMLEHILEAYPTDTVLTGQDRIAAEIIGSCGAEYIAEAEDAVLENALHRNNAFLGGDIRTGKVIWKRFQPGADGFLLMALTLEMLALSGQSLPEITASLR